MQISIPNGLKELSEIFPAPFYAVGGFVRDSLMGFSPKDVDLASPLTPDEVKSLLKNTRFSVKDGSKKLLTLIICDNENRYEYTTFRTDSYVSGPLPRCGWTATARTVPQA